MCETTAVWLPENVISVRKKTVRRLHVPTASLAVALDTRYYISETDPVSEK
jgi:hypothetical protein